MARLPQIGGDDGDWGKILNDYLSQIHAADGSLKPNVVGPAALAPNAVTASNVQNATIVAAKLDAGTGANGDILVKDSQSASGFKWATPAAGGGSVGNTAVGGDLTGTVSNAQIAAGAVDETTLAQAVKDKLNAVATVADGSITSVKIADGTIVETDLAQAVRDKLNATGSTTVADGSLVPAKLSADTPAQGEVLSYNGTGFEWITPQAAGGSGETNTASNVGTAGIGVFKQKTGVNLEFKSVQAGSANVTVTENTTNNTIDIDVNAGQANGLATLDANGKVPATQLPAATGGSSFGFTMKQVTAASYAAAAGDYIIADPVAGKITITLPTSAPNGFVRIKRIASGGSLNSIDIMPGAGAYIDAVGVGAHTLNSQFESMEFWSDGTNWYR